MEKRKFFTAKRITGLAVLFALVIVLQMLSPYIKIGATSLSFVLVPIVLGSLLYGPIAGAILGCFFGFVVIVQGLTGLDGFTLLMLQDHPLWTTLICLLKGTMAGLVPAFAYQLIGKKSRLAGVLVAASLAPIMNTGLFILGALCFLRDTIVSNPDVTGFSGDSIMYYLIVFVAGTNFLVEFAINLILSPVIYRVVNVIGGKMGERKEKKDHPQEVAIAEEAIEPIENMEAKNKEEDL